GPGGAQVVPGRILIRWREFEVRRRDQAAVRHEHGSLQPVLELPDVAGPAMLGQSRKRVVGKAADGASELAVELRQEVAREQDRVGAPVPEWRNAQRDRVQTVE